MPGVSAGRLAERSAPCAQANAPTTTGDELDVPENRSVYQMSSDGPPCRSPYPVVVTSRPTPWTSMLAPKLEKPNLDRSGPWSRPWVPGGGAPAPTSTAPLSRLLRSNGFVQLAGKSPGRMS